MLPKISRFMLKRFNNEMCCVIFCIRNVGFRFRFAKRHYLTRHQYTLEIFQVDNIKNFHSEFRFLFVLCTNYLFAIYTISFWIKIIIMDSKEPCTSSSTSSKNAEDENSKKSSNDNQKKSSDGQYECNICLDNATDAVISLCGHLFW